ncbi:MAG: MBL fold metallo-hydrolase [Pseudonocardiaceae bacterium]|nr:MBL fold metallo-hydrolase [Pseudonocardiaceae bacterium]
MIDSESARRDSSVYDVFAVRYGTRTTSKSEVYLNYHVYGEPDATVGMDYFFWIARSPESVIVIDTGFATDVGVRRGRTILCEPSAALANLGLTPADVSQVVVTHAHYDHIGNLGLFPNAEIVIARREFEFWTGPYATRLQFAAPVERSETARLSDIWRQGRLSLVGERETIAAGVEAVVVGGHTPGQLVVLVSTDYGQAVLASDALHYYEEYERDRPFAILADLEDMYRAYDMLGEIASDPGRLLVAGHDPDVLKRFQPIGDADDALAIRIA